MMLFWGTYENLDSSESLRYSLTSMPPTSICPDETSYTLCISLTTVLFPHPVGPIMASVWPLATLKLTSSRTLALEPG